MTLTSLYFPGGRLVSMRSSEIECLSVHYGNYMHAPELPSSKSRERVLVIVKALHQQPVGSAYTSGGTHEWLLHSVYLSSISNVSVTC